MKPVPELKLSSEGWKLLSTEPGKLRGGLGMLGRGKVKVNPRGWCRGTRSISQIQRLGEEVGLLFELRSFVEPGLQPNVSTGK